MRKAKRPLWLVAGALLSVLLGSAPVQAQPLVQAQLSVEPQSLAVTLPQGETEARTVTLTNAGSGALAFCLSFDRPLQRVEGTTQLIKVGEGSACGDYGELLYLIDHDGLPGCCADPYGLTMTPEGRIFAAESNGGRTYELDAALSYVRMFEHPEVSELGPFPGTRGVAYSADTGTLWWLNIESFGFTVRRALLLEGGLDGVPTGRRIELPVTETAPPPFETGRPVGLSYDAATQHFYYTDIANDNVWAVDTLGNVVDGYPVTPEAYPGVSLAFGLDAHPSDVGEAAESVRLDLYVNPPGSSTPGRIGVVAPLGGDLGAGTTLETPIPDLTGGTGGGGVSGEPVRSRLDPNGVLYVPFGNFDTEGVAAIRPHPLPPSWLVVSEWNGTLEPGESRAVELTFQPGQRAVGNYTTVLQAFTAATGEAAEVPLALTVTQGTDAEDEPTTPATSSLTVHPNPTAGQATVTLTLSAAAEVRAAVYDVLGREVAVLHEGLLSAGTHELTLDGVVLPTGVYLGRASGDSFAVTQRFTITR